MYKAPSFGLGMKKDLRESIESVYNINNSINEEEQLIISLFEEFLEENFHVEMLTEEDLDYVFENEFPQWLEEKAAQMRSMSKARKSGAATSLLNQIRNTSGTGSTSLLNQIRDTSGTGSTGLLNQIRDTSGTGSTGLLNQIRDTSGTGRPGAKGQVRSRGIRSGANVLSPEGRPSQGLLAKLPAEGVNPGEDAQIYRATSNPERASQRPGAQALATPPSPERASQRPGAQVPAGGVNPGEDALIKRAQEYQMTGGLSDAAGSGRSSSKATPPNPRKQVSARSASTVSAKPSISSRKQTGGPSLFQQAKQAVRPTPGNSGRTATDRLKYMAARGNRASQKALRGPKKDWRSSVFNPDGN